MERIIFATHNDGKMREIRKIMEGTGIQVVSAKEAGVRIQAEETGTTFEENARIKAQTVMEATGEIVMADDSGLEVDWLDKAPGVYSARFMGEDTGYDIKNQAIIDALADAPEEKRTARFVCAIACVFPDGRVLQTRETMEGVIAHQACGTGGFGYDPIFFLPDRGCTSAELTTEGKNAISHRGKALRAMKELLEGQI